MTYDAERLITRLSLLAGFTVPFPQHEKKLKTITLALREHQRRGGEIEQVLSALHRQGNRTERATLLRFRDAERNSDYEAGVIHGQMRYLKDVPGAEKLIAALRAEWDALMIETYTPRPANVAPPPQAAPGPVDPKDELLALEAELRGRYPSRAQFFAAAATHSGRSRGVGYEVLAGRPTPHAQAFVEGARRLRDGHEPAERPLKTLDANPEWVAAAYRRLRRKMGSRTQRDFLSALGYEGPALGTAVSRLSNILNARPVPSAWVAGLRSRMERALNAPSPTPDPPPNLRLTQPKAATPPARKEKKRA